MRALLLAAGFGTRLRPLTNKIPKCLVRINGKPLLQYWLEALSEAGIQDILVNTHYLSGEVEAFIKKSQFSKYITVTYEEHLLGTGGTLLKNKDFFKGERILLIHADNLSKLDIKAFVKRHQQRPDYAVMTMMTFNTDNPQSCGILELDNSGMVVRFHEKVANPPGNLANGAVYILENEVMEYILQTGKAVIDFSTDVIPHFIGRIYTFHNAVYHRDIGDLISYKIAQKDFEQ